MNLEEFETQYRNNMEQTLNQLQTAFLLLANLQIRLTNVSQDLQNLNEVAEEFFTQQKER